jgi:hypothetical protein
MQPTWSGKTTLVVDFVYDGGGMGKCGNVATSAHKTKIAEGRLQRTIPIQFSLGEGLDVGMDVGSAIDFTYKLPFAFTGKIAKVTIELGPMEVAPSKPEKKGRGEKAIGEIEDGSVAYLLKGELLLIEDRR